MKLFQEIYLLVFIIRVVIVFIVITAFIITIRLRKIGRIKNVIKYSKDIEKKIGNFFLITTKGISNLRMVVIFSYCISEYLKHI